MPDPVTYTTYASSPPSPSRRRSRRCRVALVAGVVLLAATALSAALVGVVVGATRGMPPLSRLLAEPQAQTSLLFDSSGHLIGQVHGAVDRVDVTSSQIPTALKQATVAIEDKRYYTHHGVDPLSVARAALADLRAGHIVEGSSTIEMQYVKNAYLGGEGNGLVRKIREAVLAWQLDDVWSKDQVLTAYLNTVYYGSGAYGVEAAAQTFFHKHVWQLDLPECALLAALPRFPSGYSPVNDPKDALARRDVVLQQMREQGYITSAQAAAASATALDVFDRPPQPYRGPAAYFVQYVTQQLVQRYGTQATFEGGLRVTTSLDLRMQRDAIAALSSTLPKGPAGALVSIDPATGYVRAMVSTTDYKTSQFNLAWQARRQLGSAMKPFALVAAVLQGADPATTYYTSEPLHLYLGPGAVPPYWNVTTFSGTYPGRINLVQATLQSDNTVYAQLALDVGPRNIVSVAHRMGITSPLHPYPSVVLGTEPVNPLEVADAYATFAAEGVRHRPQAIEKVVFPDGRVDVPAVTAHRAIPAGAAYVVDKILEENTQSGTAAAIPSYYSGVAAGKTGTTNDSADAWFCGFNPRLATVIWTGYPQGEIPMPGVEGATYAVPAWGKYYEMVFGSQPVPDFAQPAKMPVWKPWTGAHSVGSPAPVVPPSASPGTSTMPTPAPTQSGAPAPSRSPSSSPSPAAIPAQQ
jgi:penicillin-binding protein 1A